MIEFYAAPTPNCWKVSIALEELAAPYRLHRIDLSKNDQRAEAYLAINPNGKVPAICDAEADQGPLPIFESGAILLYLAEKAGQLISDDVAGRAQTIQWLMFQMSAIGPMMGQLAVFLRYAPERIPYAVDRYRNEVQRLFGVLDRQLEGREYICSNYSIADIALFPWVSTHDFIEIGVEDFPHVRRWIQLVGERPAVCRGMQIPRPVVVDEEEIARRRSNLS